MFSLVVIVLLDRNKNRSFMKNIHPQWYLWGFICTFLLVLASHHFEISPGTHHFGGSITVESLLHFYSLLFPCALQKIITHEWPRLNPATLLLYIQGRLCSLVQNRAHSLALWPCVIIWETIGAVLCWKCLVWTCIRLCWFFIIHIFSSLSLVLKVLKRLLDERKRLWKSLQSDVLPFKTCLLPDHLEFYEAVISTSHWLFVSEQYNWHSEWLMILY